MKYPGNEVAIWTILWAIAGAVVAFTSFRSGSVGLGVVFAVLPIACALIWFDIGGAKWVIVGYFSIAAIGAITLLFTRGFTWIAGMRIIMAMYFAFTMARWQGGPSDE